MRPGELNGLVPAYLRNHEEAGLLTATAIAKGHGGSSAGAVANCLERLARSRPTRLVTRKPRAYELRRGDKH